MFFAAVEFSRTPSRLRQEKSIWMVGLLQLKNEEMRFLLTMFQSHLVTRLPSMGWFTVSTSSFQRRFVDTTSFALPVLGIAFYVDLTLIFLTTARMMMIREICEEIRNKCSLYLHINYQIIKNQNAWL